MFREWVVVLDGWRAWVSFVRAFCAFFEFGVGVGAWYLRGVDDPAFAKDESISVFYGEGSYYECGGE